MMLGSITSTTDFNCTTNHNAKQYYILQNIITFHRQSFYSTGGRPTEYAQFFHMLLQACLALKIDDFCILCEEEPL